MSASDPVLWHALIAALGWTLLHFLWQGCVLAGFFWLVCLLSSPGNAHLRYWAGVCGLFLSLVSLLITFSVYYRPEAVFVAEPAESGAINPFLVLSGLWPDVGSLLQHGLEPVLPVIVLLWVAGVLIQSTQAVLGWAGIRKLIQVGTTDIGGGLQAAIGDLQQLLGVSHPVRVLKSAMVKVPMTAGWLKPVILLPAGVLAQLPRDQLEMIIAHELGHIRRFDHVFNLFQILMETLLFYHPAITWMSNRVRQERETCCDDLVVARCKRPATYARALANLEVMRGDASTLILAAVGGDLLGRIKRITDRELPRPHLGYVQVLFLSLVTVLVGLGARQGVLLSDALNKVAGSVRLQASDVELKTWNSARSAWGRGLQGYAAQVQAIRAATLAEPGAAPLRVAAVPLETADSRLQTRPAETPGQTQVAVDPQWHRQAVAAPALPLEQIAAEVPVTSSLQPAVAHPTPLLTAAPRYPWRALTKGIEGFVELAFSLDSSGNVVDIEVIDSLPDGIFERAATRALKKWKFAQAEDLGAPRRLVQKFDFNLEQKTLPEPRTRNCAPGGHRVCQRIPANAVVVYINPRRDTEALSRVN